MNIKTLVVEISNKDIKNFLKLQNKINIKEVTINENINVVTEIEFLSKVIECECILSVVKVENNNIYLDIKNFSIAKFNIMNKMIKKALNYFIEGFTDIKGISFQDESFKLDVDKIINQYYKAENSINLNELQLTTIDIKSGIIELILEGIKIDTNKLNDDKEENIEFDEDVDFIEVCDFQEELK